MPVKMTREMRAIPTYVPGEPQEMPMFFEKKPYQGATGRVYPIPYTDKISNTPSVKEYDMVTLSNEYITVELLPEIGGKIHGAWSNKDGYEFIYKNTCIKPAMVGLAGPWVSGGVEFNFPQHHRPTTFMPAEATLRENADGSKTCIMGEAEPFHRLRSQVAVTLRSESSLVEADITVTNPTDAPLPFMWWNNLAVRVHGKYKAVFPPDCEWGSDHDRRAIISFPEMKGIYKTARPYDYGEGTDVTWFSNVKLPTSVMVLRGQSDMDFLGGYDFAANAGTVTVSDHHYSPGKKMWTWGDGDFGRAWCGNLTDNGDRYIELMTGVFTDNQPDFTYIMPGETKQFSTCWYPVRDIGPVCNATRKAAVSTCRKGGELQVGVITTSPVKGAKIAITANGKEIALWEADIDPDTPCIFTCPLPGNVPDTSVTLAVQDAAGNMLVTYTPPEKGTKQQPKPRQIPPRPADIATNEELYFHGAHLEQYKHHTFLPEDYYLEALRRDPTDERCNLAMGKIEIEKGNFEKAEQHLAAATDKIKMRNDNPADTEAVYQLARLRRLQGRYDEAYDMYADASWQYQWRSAALFEMGCISCLRGDRKLAVQQLTQSLSTNSQHISALTLRGYLTGSRQDVESALAISCQSAFPRFAMFLMTGEEVGSFTLGRSEDVLDAALSFLRAGLREEAARVLQQCTSPNQLTEIYLAKIQGRKPEEGSMRLCFPNRLEDIAGLSSFPDMWQAQYLLGCLMMDRQNYAAARSCFEKTIELNPGCAFARRNLAQVLFDHFGMKDEARQQMEKALESDNDNPRLVYELLQLYKNIHMSVEFRLNFLENHAEAAKSRDDCFLDMIILRIQRGEYAKAREMLSSKRFNIYEGGEGKLTRTHTWLHTIMGREAYIKGDFAEAKRLFEQALVYPANYGEGRHYSAQEANMYYHLGLMEEEMGNDAESQSAWQKAADEPGQITEISYFAALSLRKLGQEEKCCAMLEDMTAEGERLVRDCDRYGYFGVGMATPLPFEIDVKPLNLAQGYLLMMLGHKGLGHEKEYQECRAKLAAVDPWNVSASYLQKVGAI